MCRKPLLIVAAGTFGDVLPAARIAQDFSQVECSVVTNERHFSLFPGKPRFDIGFDPTAMFASELDRRLLSGGPLDPRRIASMRSLVAQRVQSVLSQLRPLLQNHRAVLVSGMPFGINALAESEGAFAVQLRLNPAWPTTEFPTFYLNSAMSLGPVGNRLTYTIAEVTAQLMFRGIMKQQLGHETRHLLFDGFYDASPTIFAIPPGFTSKAIRKAPNAVVTGFIRPPSLPETEEFTTALKRLEQLQSRTAVIYLGLGALRTDVALRTIQLLADIIDRRGLVLAVQCRRADAPRGENIVHVPHGDHRRVFPFCTAINPSTANSASPCRMSCSP